MISAAFLDRLVVFLAPLFVTATLDIEAAGIITRETLLSYGARTDRELRLAALNLAFSISALDAMSRAADPLLPLNQTLRLRGNANALNRAANQTEARFDALRKQHDDVPDAECALPDGRSAEELLAFAKSHLAPSPAPLSRQQRRAAERKAAKAQQRQAELDRLAHRAAALAVSRQVAARAV